MIERTPLPNRRENVIEYFDFHDARWHVGIGFDADGSPREVFLKGPKAGSDFEALLNDACVCLSIMLQMDVSPELLADKLSEHSPIGKVVRRLSNFEVDA